MQTRRLLFESNETSQSCAADELVTILFKPTGLNVNSSGFSVRPSCDSSWWRINKVSGGERREEMFDAVMLLCCIVHLPSAVKEGRCCHPLGGGSGWVGVET